MSQNPYSRPFRMEHKQTQPHGGAPATGYGHALPPYQGRDYPHQGFPQPSLQSPILPPPGEIPSYNQQPPPGFGRPQGYQFLPPNMQTAPPYPHPPSGYGMQEFQQRVPPRDINDPSFFSKNDLVGNHMAPHGREQPKVFDPLNIPYDNIPVAPISHITKPQEWGRQDPGVTPGYRAAPPHLQAYPVENYSENAYPLGGRIKNNIEAGKRTGYEFVNPVGGRQYGANDSNYPPQPQRPRDDVYMTPAQPHHNKGFATAQKDGPFGAPHLPPQQQQPPQQRPVSHFGGNRNYNSFLNPLTGGPSVPEITRGPSQRPDEFQNRPDYNPFRSPQRPYTEALLNNPYRNSKDDFYLDMARSPSRGGGYPFPGANQYQPRQFYPGDPFDYPVGGEGARPVGGRPYDMGEPPAAGGIYPSRHGQEGVSRYRPSEDEFRRGPGHVPPALREDDFRRGPTGLGNNRPPHKNRRMPQDVGGRDQGKPRYHLSPDAERFRNRHLKLDQNGDRRKQHPHASGRPISKPGGKGNAPHPNAPPSYNPSPLGQYNKHNNPYDRPEPSRYGGFPEFDVKPTPHYPPAGENYPPYTPSQNGPYFRPNQDLLRNPDYQRIIRGAAVAAAEGGAQDYNSGKPLYGRGGEYGPSFGVGPQNPYLQNRGGEPPIMY